jgi:hypothetical protein
MPVTGELSLSVEGLEGIRLTLKGGENLYHEEVEQGRKDKGPGPAGAGYMHGERRCN